MHNQLQYPLGGLFLTHWKAESDCHYYLERRARQLERTLIAVLANDLVSDEQRAKVLEIMRGKRAVGQDPKILSDQERDMIEQYRSMDAAGRQMIRTLFARLATTSEVL